MYTDEMTADDALSMERALKSLIVQAKTDEERERHKADLEDVRARRTLLAARAIKWQHIGSGQYYAYGRTWDTGIAFTARVVLINGNWNLSINDKFQGYYGTARDAKAAAHAMLASGKLVRHA